jgi:acyl-CoA synthetase (AMP-forming)/AMP-acid ligase II
MAESSLAVTFTELEEGMKTLFVDGERLWAEGEAFVLDATAEAAVPLVSCGPTFAGHDLQIFAIEDAGSATPFSERKVGEIRIKGPSVMHGYWEDAEKSKEAFAGEFLRTGDLGFVHEGRLYICGRSKEVIIVNGRNYYPQDIEWEASKVDGVRKGNVIAFGTREPGSDKEKVIVAFEVTLNPGETLEVRGLELTNQVRTNVQQGLGLTVDDAVPVVAGALPKTSSGKLQRTKTRELYDAGELSDRKGKRDEDKLDLIKAAAKSQLSFLKLAVLGRKKDK